MSQPLAEWLSESAVAPVSHRRDCFEPPVVEAVGRRSARWQRVSLTAAVLATVALVGCGSNVGPTAAISGEENQVATVVAASEGDESSAESNGDGLNHARAVPSGGECFRPEDDRIVLVAEEPATGAEAAAVSGWHWMASGSEDGSDYSHSAAAQAASQLVGLGLEPVEELTLCLYQGGAGVGPPPPIDAGDIAITRFRLEVVRSTGEQVLLSGFGFRPELPSEHVGVVALAQQAVVLYPDAVDRFESDASQPADGP